MTAPLLTPLRINKRVVKTSTDLVQGSTFFHITHCRNIMEVTDRIVVLRLGKVVKDAPTSDFTVETLLGTITGLIAD